MHNRFPTLFLSHGSPLYALDAGAAGTAWEAMVQRLPKPRVIIVITAHWETNLPMLSGNAKPNMIYDFGGFPDALYQISYPAPGAPDTAALAVARLKAADITAAIDGCRGFDHGTWVPLARMFPNADIPVVQLSVQPTLGVAHAYRVGAALAALRDEGVLIVGSGHMTHNLEDWMARSPMTTEYVTAFQTWMLARLTANTRDDLTHYRERAPHAVRAHPTEEHLLPLFVAHGAAGAMLETPSVARTFSGLEGGALALDAYRFD